MAQVPANDLPSNLVPADDLPTEQPDMPLWQKMFRGMVTGGPVGMGAAALGNASDKINEMVQKGAYQAGGAVTDFAASHGASPEVAAGTGFATNMGVQAIPVLLGGMGGNKAKAMIQSGAERLMQGALKPDKLARDSGQGTEAVKTMLTADNGGFLPGYNVSNSGVDKLNSAIGAIDDKLQTALSTSNKMVSKQAVADKVIGVMNDVKTLDIAPQDKLNTLGTLYTNVINNKAIPDQIKVGAANEMKRYIYKELGPDFYAKFLPISQQVERQGRAALGQGLKEGIEQAVPEAKAFNQQMAPLINARNIAENRVLVAGNRDPLSFGALALSHPIEAGSWLAQRSPPVMSTLARLGYHAAGPLATAGGASAGGILSLLMNQRGN